jgi:hypothetical protein
MVEKRREVSPIGGEAEGASGLAQARAEEKLT